MRISVFRDLARLTGLAAVLGLAFTVTPVCAEAAASSVPVDAARLAALDQILQIPPLLAVIREEGLAYGASLDAEMLQGQGGVPWRAEVAAIEGLVRVGDLIESNVAGTLNANLALYRGLKEGGGLARDMTDDEMLAEVWGSEGAVRQQAEAWLYPYLALAYAPSTDAELQAYVDFSASPAGQRANAAVFAAFDAIFGKVSHDLGLAAARKLRGQDI